MSDNNLVRQLNAGDYGHEDDIDLVEYFQLIWRKKWLIFALSFLIALATYVACKFVITRKYEVKALVTAPSSSNKLSSMLGQLSSIPGLGDLAGGGDSKSGMLMALLSSRSLADRVVNDLNLLPVFYLPEKYANITGPKKPILEDAVNFLQTNVVKVTQNKKDQTIQIVAKWKDADLAVKIVEKMLLALQDMINQNSYTEAKRQKIFIKEQLQQSRMSLLESGKQLQRFYGAGVSSVSPKLNVDLGASELIPQTYEDLRVELDKLESLPSTDVSYGQVRNVKDVPAQVYYTFLQQEQFMQSKVNALLAQQYEMAKIEEIKEQLSFQIIDKPFATKRNYSPKAGKTTMVAFAVSLVFITMFIVFAHAFGKMRESRKLSN